MANILVWFLNRNKLFIAGNSYSGSGGTKFSVVRYGNVVASRGSVVELYLKLKKRNIKEFPVTDRRMTRFWMTLDESVEIVLKALTYSEGGEVFVPKVPSMKMIDLAKAIDPKCRIKIIGIRPGEKIHETLISEDESRNVRIFDGTYLILPQFLKDKKVHKKYKDCPSMPEGFIYRSDINKKWLTATDLRKMAGGA